MSVDLGREGRGGEGKGKEREGKEGLGMQPHTKLYHTHLLVTFLDLPLCVSIKQMRKTDLPCLPVGESLRMSLRKA